MSLMSVVASACVEELQKEAVFPLVPLAIGAAKMIGTSLATDAGMNAVKGLGRSKKPVLRTPSASKPAPSMNAAPNGGNYTY